MSSFRYSRLRLPLRVAIPAIFLSLSLCAAIATQLLPWLIIALCILLAGRAWRISAARFALLLLMCIPLLMGLVVTHFDVTQRFVYRYVVALFTVAAVVLFVDMIHVEEWIFMFHRRGRKMSLDNIGSVVIGCAVGQISLSAAIKEQRRCRAMAAVSSWGTKSAGSLRLDDLTLPFYNAIASYELLDNALNTWSEAYRTHTTSAQGTSSQLPSFGNSNCRVTLSDVYDFPLFSEFAGAVFSSRAVSKEWLAAISGLNPVTPVLEIGAGTGRFTQDLLRAGLRVVALERNEIFCGKLVELASHSGGRCEVLRCIFPALPRKQFHSIVLHQNVFLELANGLGFHAALNAVCEIAAPGATILLDHPDEISTDDSRQIFEGEISGVGHVDYSYFGHEQKGITHTAILKYHVAQTTNNYFVQAPFVVDIPTASTIMAFAEILGFTTKATPIDGQKTFIANSMVLLTMINNS
jgi:hypothetical protein